MTFRGGGSGVGWMWPVAASMGVLLGVGACGARTELPGLGDSGGGGQGLPLTGAGVTTGAPSCSPVEGCNGRDDDCDGDVDEGCIDVGCADGQREGFSDVAAFPDIAACAGGFALPGVFAPVAACGRQGGDDGPRPGGDGCSAEDLCAPGWTVCPSEAEVARLAGTCEGAAEFTEQFFATQQTGPGCGICALGTRTDPACDCTCVDGCAPGPATTNDVFGCGSIGDAASRCGVLDRFSNNLCGQLPAPWDCSFGAPDGGNAGCREALAVRKRGPEHGGVLCCRAIREGG